MSAQPWFDEPTAAATGSPGGAASFEMGNMASTVAASSLGNEIAAQFASNMYENTKSKARGVIDLYANIDLIRPYFDVYPSHVLQRLIGSLLPRKTSPLVHDPLIGENAGANMPAAGTTADLYGPVMLCFTLASLVQLGLKLSSTSVIKEGTLVGTSLFVVFMYWIMSSMLYSFLAFMFSASITVLQSFSVSGYALFGPCVSMLIHCFLQSAWLDTTAPMVLGALSALSMAVLFFFKTPRKNHAATFAMIVIAVHFGFVLWMHLVYTSYPIPSSPHHAGQPTPATAPPTGVPMAPIVPESQPQPAPMPMPMPMPEPEPVVAMQHEFVAPLSSNAQ